MKLRQEISKLSELNHEQDSSVKACSDFLILVRTQAILQEARERLRVNKCHVHRRDQVLIMGYDNDFSARCLIYNQNGSLSQVQSQVDVVLSKYYDRMIYYCNRWKVNDR